MRPDCQDPGFACSSASRYRTFETTILSTIWLLGTSSHELWSVVNQTALRYLAYQAGTRFQIFGGRGPDLVLNIKKMVGMDFFRQKLMSNAYIHGKQGVALKKFDVSRQFRLLVASTHRPRKSDSPLRPKNFRQCENQA